MDEPDLILSKKVYPLWLEAPMDDRGVVTKSKKMALDERRLIPIKFKPQPTTPAEVEDCSAKLTQDDIAKLKFHPKSMDFGTLVAYSTVKRSYFITNELQQNILVEMHFEDDYIMKSTPLSQVVPPGEVAGFDIAMCSTVAQTIRSPIHFVINGQHHFNFYVLADIQPIKIIPNTNKLQLRFADDNVEPTTISQLTLTNPGNDSATFAFHCALPKCF